ncbi:MAG: hypothetical protein QM796_05110 [Chthoniobacteraceae bacterium]
MKRTILIALLALPLAAFAGPEVDSKSVPAPTPALQPSAISGDIGVTVLNNYNTRGIIVESRGVITQPYADLYLKLYNGDGFINSFSLQGGIWNDFSSTGQVAKEGHELQSWTEFDWDAGFIVKFAKRFTLSSVYLQYVSPSDAYRLGRFINSTLSFDDSGILDKNFSIQPSLTFLYELPGPGHAGLRGHSWYFSPGITPNYTFFKESSTPVNVGLPIYAGLGSSFYAGRTFGYFAFGPQVNVKLGFIPQQFGTWNFGVGYRFYTLGSTTQAIAPGQRSTQHLFQASLGLVF